MGRAGGRWLDPSGKRWATRRHWSDPNGGQGAAQNRRPRWIGGTYACARPTGRTTIHRRRAAPRWLWTDVLLSWRFAFRFKATAHSLLRRHGARISGSWLLIWNEGGEFWCEAPASGNEPHPRPSRFHARDRRPEHPTCRVDRTETAPVQQALESFRGMEIPGSTGIPVLAGGRESDAWWDSSFRSSARPGSRP